MKKIIERLDSSYHLEITSTDSVTTSMPFEENSDRYLHLISKGCEVINLSKEEKDAYSAQQRIDLIKKELSALDVPSYKLQRAIAGDQKAIDDIKSAEKKKVLLRAKL